MWAALVRLFGPFRAPPDDVALAALAFAVIVGALAWRAPKLLGEGSRRWFFVLGGATAAFLSLGYAAFYLRGGPRIIDATTYWLQGRTLSQGWIAFPIADPAASFRGRFLVGSDPDHLAGVFPPGYPLLLAAGFLIDAPMLVGPLLAGGIFLATHRLALELGRHVPTWDDETRAYAARGAALFSLACAALRYHTADTMSHGLVALLVTLALAAALRARREGSGRFFGVGLFVGAILATRLVSALPIALVSSYLLGTSDRTVRGRAALRFGLGLIPAIALLLVVQRAATGSLFMPTQTAYYAASDGPPGCFRWGFGEGIGCVYEHGDFVRARLPHGYGLVAALGTTVRRLHVHLDDAFAGWPLTLGLVGYLLHRRRALPPVLGIAGALVVLQIAAYLPFYFDGDYPGGGARFYADVLPVEHAAIAIALLAGSKSLAASGRRILAVLASSALLFATHGAFAHRSLAERDGGKPMWDDKLARDVGADRGLVFVDTDHAFALAFDPESAQANKRTIARFRGDDHDRLLYERLGKPSAFLHRWNDGNAQLLPWVPPVAENASGVESWRFEGESMWPPFAQQRGWAIPEWHSDGCASGGRALVARAQGTDSAEITLSLPIPRRGTWVLVPHVVNLGSGSGALIARSSTFTHTWSWSSDTSGTCAALEGATYVAESESPLTLLLRVESSIPDEDGAVALDQIEVVERR